MIESLAKLPNEEDTVTDRASALQIFGVDGVPEVKVGDDLVELIVLALEASRLTLESGDIMAVTHKIVSKAEGQLLDLREIEPSPFARQLGIAYDKDPRHVEVVLRESKRIVRMDHGVIIAETRHGFV